MSNQKEINGKKRAILVDWLVSVHDQFQLEPETLFLTINIIDRFVERAPVTMNDLQLIGAAAMLIACKYEEIMSPEVCNKYSYKKKVEDFSIITDDSCSVDEILEMEAKILHILDFRLLHSSPLKFFERFSIIKMLSPYQYYFGTRIFFIKK